MKIKPTKESKQESKLPTKIYYMGFVDNVASFLSFHGYYDEKVGKFGGPGKTIWNDRLKLHCELYGLSPQAMQEMIFLKTEYQPFQDSLQSYSCLTYQQFVHATMKQSKKAILHRNFKVFIHLASLPDGPQCWRRIVVHGGMNMKQFDTILRRSFGFGIHSSYFKIPVNDDRYFKNVQCGKTWNGKYGNYMRKDIILYNGVRESLDHRCLKNMFERYAFPMENVLFGQIGSIFYELNKDNTAIHKIPFDMFKQTFFPGFYSKYSPAQQKSRFDFDARLDNFHLDKKNCIEWHYDLGDDYAFNVYIEEVQASSEQEQIFCKFLDGSTSAPPEDMGGFVDWHKCILMCYGYDAAKHQVEGLETAEEFYEWLRDTSMQYYNVHCLVNPQEYLVYFGMSKAQWRAFVNENIVFKRPNIASVVKHRYKPFYFPYWPLREVLNERISKLNQHFRLENFHACERTKTMRNNIFKCKYCLHCKCVDKNLRKCAQCRSAYYCSRHCQKWSWLTHRDICTLQSS